MQSHEASVGQIKRRRVVILALSTLVLLFLGLIYAFSMFANPMVEDFGLEGNVGLTFNIMMIMFCSGAVVGGILDKKFGIRAALLACATLFALGFCGTGLLGTMGTPFVYLFYGVFGGLGCGIGYNTIIATTNVWFPDRVGLSSGMLMMGFSFASLVFGNIALLLRPIMGGMASVLMLLGLVVAVLVCVLAFLLKRPPTNIIELMAPERISTESGVELGEDDNIFKTPIFYVYYVWCIVVMGTGLAVIGSAASDASSLGASASSAALLVGLVSMFSGFARIVIGVLYDRTNIKLVMVVEVVVAAVAVVCIISAFLLGASALYVVGALMCGFSYGGVPVVTSTFARQRFGAKNYPKNLSIVGFGGAFGSMLNIAIGAVLGSDGRMEIFATLLVMLAFAGLVLIPFSRMWDRDTSQVKCKAA